MYSTPSKKRKASTPKRPSKVKKMKMVPVVKSKFPFIPGTNLKIFPRKLRQTLTYCEQFPVTVNAVAFLTNWHTFRANGLFDPRFAIGGHQPMGFDQLMAIYSKYTVVGAKMTLRVCVGTQTFNNGTFGINIRDPAAAAVTTSESAIESQYSTYNTFGYLQDTKSVTLNFDGPKYFNSNDIVDDDTLAGTNTTDPARIALADFWVAADVAPPIAPNNVVTFHIKIDYESYFYEPKNVVSS